MFWLINTRNRREKGLGIGVTHVAEELFGWGQFHHSAAVHDHNFVGTATSHTQVMGDQDDGHTNLGLQILEQIKDVLLHGDIERCCWFIGDQQLRFTGQSDCNHDSLPHTAGQLVGVLTQPTLWFRDSDLRQHFDGPLRGLVLAH